MQQQHVTPHLEVNPSTSDFTTISANFQPFSRALLVPV